MSFCGAIVFAKVVPVPRSVNAIATAMSFLNAFFIVYQVLYIIFKGIPPYADIIYYFQTIVNIFVRLLTNKKQMIQTIHPCNYALQMEKVISLFFRFIDIFGLNTALFIKNIEPSALRTAPHIIIVLVT